MKTAQEIAQWVIDNRDPKAWSEVVSDFEMYIQLVEMIESLQKNRDQDDYEEEDDFAELDFDFSDDCDEGDDYSDFDCTCGAWAWSDKKYKFVHIGDCICGSSEPF